MPATTEQCRCGCCGPVDDKPEPRVVASSERERLAAQQRSAEAQVAEIMDRLDEHDRAGH